MPSIKEGSSVKEGFWELNGRFAKKERFKPILSLRKLITPLHAAITIKDFQLMKGMFGAFSLSYISLPTLKSTMILI